MSIYKNTITLKGFLGANAVEHTNSNQKPVVVLSLATKSSCKDKQSSEFVSRTDWHRVVAFGRLAESASRSPRAHMSKSKASSRAASMCRAKSSVACPKCGPARSRNSNTLRARPPKTSMPNRFRTRCPHRAPLFQ